MMKSRLDNDKKFFKVIALIIVLLSSVIVLSTIFFRSFISDAISNSYTSLFINENRYAQILDENSILKNKIEEFNIKLANDAEASSLSAYGMIDLIKANAVMRSDKIDMIYSEVLINKGEIDGVLEGDIAMFAGLIPVGYVSKLNKESSLVTLYSATDSKVNVLIEVITESSEPSMSSADLSVEDSSTTNSSNTEVVMEQSQVLSTSVKKNLSSLEAVGDGKFGLLIKADYELKVSTGSTVYLKSNPDYKLGSVVYISNNENTKEKYLFVKPNYSINDSSIFYILK